MRLVAASDVHGDLGMIRKFSKAARRLQASAVVLAGDIGPRISPILSHLSKLGLPVYTVLGNDDLPYDSCQLEGTPYILNIDGETIDIGPVEIIGCSGVHQLDVFTPDEKRIFSLLQKAFKIATKPVVLISHFPPFRVLDFATRHGENHVGSKAVRKVIQTYHPLLCICGHVHKDGGKRAVLSDTRVINIAALENNEVSKSQGRRFAIMDIDNMAKFAVSFDYLIDANIPLEKFVSQNI